MVIDVKIEYCLIWIPFKGEFDANTCTRVLEAWVEDVGGKRQGDKAIFKMLWYDSTKRP